HLVAFIATLLLTSCGDVDEKVDEIKNGTVKLDVRSREFSNSGIHNIDICVSDADDKHFPRDRAQFFFAGHDLSNLSVRWLSKSELEIALSCGRVSEFSNYAVLSAGSHPPIQFHIVMLDRCSAQP